MRNLTTTSLAYAIGLTLLLCGSAQAQKHRATHLGHPETRFAPPLETPDDLRARFNDAALKVDIASVLAQWGWQGDLDDLFEAAQTAEVTEIQIPVGTRMPFMSSRKGGRAVALFDVLWAGEAPISAYAFEFSSNGRRYRCVTPKPCSNFFLQHLGLDRTAPELTLECNAPEEVPAGRPLTFCLTVRNIGDALEPLTTVALPLPGGATLTAMTEGGVATEDLVTWEVENLAPNVAEELCATLVLPQPGPVTFDPTAVGQRAKPVQSTCGALILGVPGILLEVVDLEDPIEVGSEVFYRIEVTNQGSEVLTNIRLVCNPSVNQEFVSGSGATVAQAQDGVITMEPLPTLEPKVVATWRVAVKALAPEDVRFRVEVRSDQFERPIWEDESTHQYE